MKFRYIFLSILILFFSSIPIFAQTGPNGEFRVNGQRFQKWNSATQAYENFLVKGFNYESYPVGSFPANFQQICAWINGQIYPPGCNWPYTIFDVPYVNPYVYDRDLPLINLIGTGVGPNTGPNTIRTFTHILPLINIAGPTLPTSYPTSPLLAYANLYDVKVLAGYGIPSFDYTLPWSGPQAGPQWYHLTQFRGYVWSLQNDPNYNAVLAIGLTNENNLFFCKYPGAPALCSLPGTGQQNCCDVVVQRSAFFGFIDALAREVKYLPGTGAGFSTPGVPNPAARPIILVFNDNLADVIDSAVPNIDVWGLNVYHGASFIVPATPTNPVHYFFPDIQAITNKPVLLTEFGYDAWHYDAQSPTLGYYDPTTQANAIGQLWDEIQADYNNTANNPQVGATAGGLVFQWSDGWFKGPPPGTPPANPNGLTGHYNSSCETHDLGGWVNPLFTDGIVDEEWWGMVSPQPGYLFGQPFLDTFDLSSYPNNTLRDALWQLHIRW